MPDNKNTITEEERQWLKDVRASIKTMPLRELKGYASFATGLGPLAREELARRPVLETADVSPREGLERAAIAWVEDDRESAKQTIENCERHVSSRPLPEADQAAIDLAEAYARGRVDGANAEKDASRAVYESREAWAARAAKFEAGLQKIAQIGCMQQETEPEFWCKKDGSAHSIYCPKGIAEEALRG